MLLLLVVVVVVALFVTVDRYLPFRRNFQQLQVVGVMKTTHVSITSSATAARFQ